MKHTLRTLAVAAAVISGAASANPATPAPTFKAPDAFRQCGPVLNQLADFFIKGKDRHDAYVLNHETAPNDRLLSALLVTETKGERDLINLVVAPTAGGCDATYTHTLLVPATCSDLRNEAVKAFKPIGTLVDVPLMRNDAGVAMVTFDVPNVGCLVTRTETVFFNKQ